MSVCMLCVCVCVCVCVCACMCVLPLRLLITSDVIWHDMDPILLVLQLLLWQLQSVSLMGMALALIHILETNPIRVS